MNEEIKDVIIDKAAGEQLISYIMKYLLDYTKQKITELLKKYNAFDEQKKDGIKYVSRGVVLVNEAGVITLIVKKC